MAIVQEWIYLSEFIACSIASGFSNFLNTDIWVGGRNNDMSEQASLQNNNDFNALTTAVPSLPTTWYYDPDHYAREVLSIWRRNWLYVCHVDALRDVR